MRRLLVTVALVAGAVAVPAVGAVAESGESAAQKAAREIQAARDEANAAAQAWEEAKVELQQLEDDEALVQTQQAQLQTEVDELSSAVEQAAINRFMSGSVSGIPLLNGLSGPTDEVQARVLLAIVNDSSAAQLNDYQIAADALTAKNAELVAAQERTRQAQEYLAATQAEAEARVVHLQEVEQERLRDEAIRQEVERIQREQREREAAAQEAAARAAAADDAQQQTLSAVPLGGAPARGGGEAVAPPSSSGGDTGDSSASSSSGDGGDGSPAPADGADASGSSDDSSSDGGGSTDQAPTATTSAPAPTAPPATSATAEAPPVSDGPYVDTSIVCPVPGAAFGDTWGAARSGGRKHEGVDMIGSLGMPIYAATSGTVQFKQTPLGGNSAWVNGDNGNRYFYAHLNGFEGSSRSVQQGELIAYMGHTGNANGVNHLHFEIHPGGGSAVNPYPSVLRVC